MPRRAATAVSRSPGAVHGHLMRGPVKVAVGLLLAIGSGASATGGDEASVRVEVSGLESRAGDLRCSIYASEEGFPETGGLQRQVVALGAGPATCVFSNLPPGTYAVSVHHDENRDGKLNRGIFGAPTEGYGVSNNRTYALSAPRWGESQFLLAVGEARTVSVILRN